MALLRLPLAMTGGGMLERASADDQVAPPRLRLFLLSGMGEYLRLPSPGIRALWIHLYTMGATSRFRDQIPLDERTALETTIRGEVNHWLEGTTTVRTVDIIGDADTPNGIRFRTDQFESTFMFEFALKGRGLQESAVGSWNVLEETHAVH